MVKDWNVLLAKWKGQIQNADDSVVSDIETVMHKLPSLKNRLWVLKGILETKTENQKIQCDVSLLFTQRYPEHRDDFLSAFYQILFCDLISRKKYTNVIYCIRGFDFQNICQPREITVLIPVLQQLTYACHNSDSKNIPELTQLLRHFRDAIPYIKTDSQLMFKAIELFVGKYGVAQTLVRLLEDDTELNAILTELFVEDFVLNPEDSKKLTASWHTYADRVMKFELIRPNCHGIDILLVQRLHKFVKLDVLLAYVKFVYETRKSYDSQNLIEFDSEIVKGVKGPQTAELIESVVLIASTLKHIVETLKSNIDDTTVQVFVKTVQNLINIVKNHQSLGENVFCGTCKSTKRHATYVLISAAMDIFIRVATRRVPFTEKLGKSVFGLVEYLFKTLDGLFCDKKTSLFTGIMKHLFNIVACYKFFEMGSELIPIRGKIVKLFRAYIHKIPSTCFKQSQLLQFYINGYDKVDPVRHLNATCLYFLSSATCYSEKDIMAKIDQIQKLRNQIPDLKDLSIARIVTHEQFEDFDLPAATFNVPRLILLEMEYNFQYTRSNLNNMRLFNELVRSTEDMDLLSMALFMLDVDGHKCIEADILQKIVRQMEKLDTHRGHLTLGLIRFREYSIRCDELQTKFLGLKEKFEVDTYSTQLAVVETSDIRVEAEVLDLLEKSLEHFERAFRLGDIEPHFSRTKIVKILENVAAHFRVRNYEKRAMEAQILAITVAQKEPEKMKWAILQSYSVFLEDSEQFSKMSKTKKIHAVVTETSQKLTEFLKSFETLDFYKQSILLSSMISLARYYIHVGDQILAQELLERTEKTYKTLVRTDNNNENYFRVLKIKFNMTCFEFLQKFTSQNRSLYTLVFFIMDQYKDIKEYKTAFSIHLTTMMFKCLLELGYQSLHKHENTFIELYLMMIYKHALKLGASLRSIQILTLRVQFDLKRENLSAAETKLQCLDKLCNFESPIIPTKTPSTTSITKNKAALPSLSSEFMTPSMDIEVVRRDAGTFQKNRQVTPPEAFCDLANYIDTENAFTPQMQFYQLLIGLAYNRLLFLNEDYAGALKFYETARKAWPALNQSIESTQEPELMREFKLFSYFMQRHYDQCRFRLDRSVGFWTESQEILDGLDARLQKDDRILAKTVTASGILKKTRSFDLQALKRQPQVPPLETPRVHPIQREAKTTARKATTATAKKQFPIFVDSPVKSARAKRNQFANSSKKTTLETSSTESAAIGLPPTLPKTSKKNSTKPVKSAEIINKKQLKFSPIVKTADEEEDKKEAKERTPKTPTIKINDDTEIVDASMITPVLAPYSTRRGARTRQGTQKK